MLKNLVPLNLPKAELKLARKGENVMVWDDIRKKYLKLTPEEWVRQHFVQFLIDQGFPKTGIALEGGFHLYKKLQRSDILVFKNGAPKLLVECKAPQVKISQETFDQASRYNLHYQIPYILITNGLMHFSAEADHDKKAYRFLQDIPSFEDL